MAHVQRDVSRARWHNAIGTQYPTEFIPMSLTVTVTDDTTGEHISHEVNMPDEVTPTDAAYLATLLTGTYHASNSVTQWARKSENFPVGPHVYEHTGDEDDSTVVRKRWDTAEFLSWLTDALNTGAEFAAERERERVRKAQESASKAQSKARSYAQTLLDAGVISEDQYNQMQDILS